MPSLAVSAISLKNGLIIKDLIFEGTKENFWKISENPNTMIHFESAYEPKETHICFSEIASITFWHDDKKQPEMKTTGKEYVQLRQEDIPRFMGYLNDAMAVISGYNEKRARDISQASKQVFLEVMDIMLVYSEEANRERVAELVVETMVDYIERYYGNYEKHRIAAAVEHTDKELMLSEVIALAKSTLAKA